jgi:hypothetical protein
MAYLVRQRTESAVATTRLLRIWIALWCALAAMFISSPGFALLTNSATLASGETTQDGRLTLVVTKLMNGKFRVSLKNNDPRTVVVDAYTLSRGPSYDCSGRGLRIPSNVTRYICTLSATGAQSVNAASPPAVSTPEPYLGQASLQMSITWHEMPVATPSPSPSPSPTPSSSPE